MAAPKRSDLTVGLFLVATIVLVVAALIATSGWGIDHYDVYVRTNDARDVAVDTKVFMQGLEVGRVASIAPRPSGRELEFIIRISVLDRFPDGQPLRLPKGTIARVESPIVGTPTLNLSIDSTGVGGTLGPSDTIRMERHAAAMEAFAGLANDLKGQIQTTLTNTNRTLEAATRLADSVANAAGAGRRFLTGTQPGAEKALAGVSMNLERLASLLDSTNRRSGVTLDNVNAVLRQSRTVMVSADSLTRLLTAMGGENRPEIATIITNMRYISEQMQYVLQELGRRPMRAVTGVRIPDTLTIEGRARRDSIRADSVRRANQHLSSDSARRDSMPPQPPTAAASPRP